MPLRLFIRVAILSSIPLVVSADLVRANSFGVNIYGLSYHINDRRGEKLFTSQGRFNEVNAGFGLRASFGTDSATTTLIVEGGAFDDTFRNLAKYLAVGFQVRIIHQFRAGINAAVYSTESISCGKPFFAPAPIVSYTVSVVTLNFVYLPKYEPRNHWHTIGAYATIHLFKGEPCKSAGRNQPCSSRATRSCRPHGSCQEDRPLDLRGLLVHYPIVDVHCDERRGVGTASWGTLRQ